ncbi:hypothetical protein ACFU44_08860 [Nocardia rhizosphaerihabitans]|uniref:hypothetical protein n=1 Tax=Nocardia rhizosphaerihabitans TaxID=1691570 RepID=UPI00366B3EE0
MTFRSLVRPKSGLRTARRVEAEQLILNLDTVECHLDITALHALSKLTARSRDIGSGRWIDADGLHWDDSGCTWWTLPQMGAGRFAPYGEDESSEAKWHQPPIDMLAGAPDWL